MKAGILSALLVVLLTPLCAQESVPEGYEIGQDSTSPDGRFALLFPVGDQDRKLPPNLLVQLNPYRVLAKVCDPGLVQGATTDLLSEWSGNSTVAIWQFRKWGIVELKVYEIKDGAVARVQDIWPSVRKVFQKDFRERFLKAYPKEAETIIFVSDEGEENPRRDFQIKGRKVLLDVFADNKPNLAGGPHWSAEMKAAWNLDSGKLENVKFKPGEISVRPDPQ